MGRISGSMIRMMVFVVFAAALEGLAHSQALGQHTAVMPSESGAQKPNIVFILVDNLGYGELGVYGGGILRGAATPRIDQLASEGTRLLNFNVEAQCTPSRSALMTGRFPSAPAPTRSRSEAWQMGSRSGR